MGNNLGVFARDKYTVTKGTDEHDRFMKHVLEMIDDLDLGLQDPAIMITRGREQLVVPVFVRSTLEEINSSMKNLYLGATDVTGTYELAKQLADDPAIDLAGYLLMAAGRLHGNFIRAELLDGEGRAYVRFADEAAVTFERVTPTSNSMSPMVAFKSTVWCSARRESQASNWFTEQPGVPTRHVQRGRP